MDTPLTPAEAFGSVLVRFRKVRGLSQEALAFESGLDRTFIARIETGNRQPGLTSILRLAKALDVSSSQLMAEVEQATNADSED